jgi:Zn-dependent protease
VEIAILALMIVMFLFSAVIHEVAHGVAALRLGDPTAQMLGRITLDPTKHIDPFWTILMPILMYLAIGIPFGGAKPVPVNPHRLHGGARKGMMWVALAGPGSNLVMALVLGIGLRVSVFLSPGAEGLAGLGQSVLVMAVQVNLILACFNMIPVPPLDGGRVAVGLLPREIAYKYASIERYGMFIIILLIVTGSTSFILLPMSFFFQLFTGIPMRL